jgi:hypothetical protein
MRNREREYTISILNVQCQMLKGIQASASGISAKDAYFSVGVVQRLIRGKAEEGYRADSTSQRKNQRRRWRDCGYTAKKVL